MISVIDSSVLIDMLDIDLLDEFYQLDIRMNITSSVAREMFGDFDANRIQNDILTGNLELYELTEKDQNGISRLMSSNSSALSEPDLSCLWLTIKINATLLTCEKPLTKTARDMGLRVHGSLWVFDRLVKSGIITKKTAHKKLVRLIGSNSRLPKAECDKRLKDWR